MKEMVISCFPNGEIQHTLRDSLFRPFEGQPRKIERMTSIVPSPDGDEFYVMILFGHWKGHVVDHRIVADLDGSGRKYPVSIRIHPVTGTFTFNSYEEAVKFEIELVDRVRLKGGKIEITKGISDD